MRKFEKVFGFTLMKIAALIRPRFGTKLALFFYSRWGMNFEGVPNYISTGSWFDGSDYSRITLGHACTISSGVSFLTHDWALHTIAKEFGVFTEKPLGIHLKISVGANSFVGRGCILLPGAQVGDGVLIGAGSVVRGIVPNHSIVVGNPAQVIGNSQEYLNKKMASIS